VDVTTKIALKASAFGLAMPLITIPLSRRLPEWLAWGVAATVGCALFQWLPPRIHRDLTPWRSAVLCVLAGVVAASAALVVGKLPT
jgi:hypothetical protein